MFCGIPCPVRIWDEKLRGKMLRALPALGGVIGGLWALLAWVCKIISLPKLVTAAVLCAAPWLLSGCIHLDGFLDCCDGIFSRRDLETRQKILKDSHVGSFALIGMALLTLLQFALLAGAEDAPLLPLALLPVSVRACAAIAISVMKKLGHSEYASAQKETKCLWFPIFCLLGSIALPLVLCKWRGLAPLVGAIGYTLAVRYGAKQLGGVSGDVSGFALTIGELCGIAALALL